MKATQFTIPGFLSPAECSALIADAEKRGFEPAPVTTSRGFVMMPDLRNNTRVIVDDTALAARLHARLAPHLPVLEGLAACGLNERFRFYRYDRGESFAWHRDGAYVRPNGDASRLTFMVYLNEGFKGGATEFEDDLVVPETGLGLVFTHHLRHQGAAVTDGRKYVLRSDVMFAC